MAGRKNNGGLVGTWFNNQIWNTSLIWLLACFAAGIAFYIRTDNTLTTYAADIKEIKASIRTQDAALLNSKNQDSAEREKVRNEFLADSKATALGISELNKQIAVMGATMVGIQKSLDAVASQFSPRGQAGPR